MTRIKYIVQLFFIFFSIAGHGHAASASSPSSWLIQQTQFAYQKIINNTSPNDGVKGSMVASTSNDNPNYHYHWVRDAGLVMDALALYYENDARPHERQTIQALFNDYINFSILLQHLSTLTGLGEPKFYVNGPPFNGPWARPQNDSPALRAISLIHWAEILIKEGKIETVKKTLYSSHLRAASPIKKDLEYIAHHWKDPTFDLWEEVKGTHFYTLMVARRALLDGAKLATYFEDHHAHQYYHEQAKKIETALQHFWDKEKGHFVATINFKDGIDYKASNLDSAVILGLLHGDRHDNFLPWDDARIMMTINYLIEKFQSHYPINQSVRIPGIAIGRYPEDKYSGTDFNGGNPWVLCTLAMAEALYRYAHVLEKQHHEKSAKNAKHLADQFILRVKFHRNQDGSLSEQINRFNGLMTSAENLTWNYAALITTRYAREQ